MKTLNNNLPIVRKFKEDVQRLLRSHYFNNDWFTDEANEVISNIKEVRDIDFDMTIDVDETTFAMLRFNVGKTDFSVDMLEEGVFVANTIALTPDIAELELGGLEHLVGELLSSSNILLQQIQATRPLQGVKIYESI